VAVLLVVGSAVGAAQLYRAKGDRVPVLVAAREVPAGKVIVREDLRVAEVDADGLAVIPAGSAATVIGRVAAARLVPGMVVTRELVADGSLLPAGEGVLSIPVAELPAGIGPEASVVVLLVGDTTGSLPAVVVDVDRPDGAGEQPVASLRLAEDQAGAVAKAAAAGEVALLLVGGSS
jgi:hypothetical protein